MAEPPEPGEVRSRDLPARDRGEPEELHLYFPVEVEVRAVVTTPDVDAAAELALGRLASGIRSAV
jgi:hypothetical protein